MKKLVAFTVIFVSFSAFGIDQAKCSKLMNNGMWKTYKYGGIDQPATKATKEVGVSKATSVLYTEATTAISDPKYWSNVSTSETQSTSSFGDCNAIGFDNIKKMRDLYFEQNSTELLAQVARGNGEFLNVLVAYSLCNDQVSARYKSVLKNNLTDILISHKPTSKIDSLVGADLELNQSCYAFN